MAEETKVRDQLAIPKSFSDKMTPETEKKVAALKATIDVHDKEKVIALGREEQGSIGNFSDSILNGTFTKDVGEAGELLTQVIGDIKGYKADCNQEQKGLFGWLRKQKTKLSTLQTKYKSVAANMDTIVSELKKKDMELAQVSRNFDVMYDANREMYEFLTMMIYAGEQVLEEEKQKLDAMMKEAESSDDEMEMQRVSDYKDDIIKFERRLYDLKLSRTISIQQAPQIRNIQKSADEVSESIKTTIVTTIPLWKNQMAIALGMQTVREGLNAVNAVKDATNAMLIANSEMNKQLTLEAAQAVERGVVDIETINKVNQNLIDSISGSYEIAQKAITERAEGAKQLQNNEAELKKAIVKYTKLN